MVKIRKHPNCVNNKKPVFNNKITFRVLKTTPPPPKKNKKTNPKADVNRKENFSTNINHFQIHSVFKTNTCTVHIFSER